MIFGPTNQQQREKRQSKIRTKAEGIQKFAWLPVKLGNGQFCWLQLYWVFYHVTCLQGIYEYIKDMKGRPEVHRTLTYDDNQPYIIKR